MRIRGQVIDFVEVETEPQEETIVDRLLKIRDSPDTSEEIRLIIQFIVGEG